MNRPRRLFLVLLSVGLAACGAASGAQPARGTPIGTSASTDSGDVPLSDPISAPRALTVTSTDFQEGGAIPMANVFNGFGCTGGNTSPALAWTGAPAGTKSFALVVHDPDAPTGVGFFHWIVFDLPASTTSLAAGASTQLPEGAVSGRTDFGASGYGGPCPPPGAPHRYAFTVYALDTEHLGADATASGALVRFMLHDHTLAYGRLVGTFGR